MSFKRIAITIIASLIVCFAMTSAQAASLSPTLKSKLNGLSNDASVGVTIITFNTSTDLNDTQLNILRGVGVTKGVTFPKLGMVGAVLNAGQVRALANNPAVLSIWSNDRLVYYMNQARMVTGVDRVQEDAMFAVLNQGSPVQGSPDMSILVIDSGIDATHADLPLGSKVVQNSQRVISSDTESITVAGQPVDVFIPATSIENVPNTDNVGHGTHCAGIAGGLGSRSAGRYRGVAPGVKIVGSGGGAVLLVLEALAGWEYGFEHARLYNIRIVTNSYGPLGGGQYDPTNPLVVAAKIAHDKYNMTVLFAGGNDGTAKDTLSPYAQAPWVIGVAAGTKDGMLADFSSRGIPREERLNDNNPFNDNEAPTLTAPGAGRFYETSKARYGFTTDIVSVRGSTNLTANGTWFANPLADTELPATTIPFYTEISGTSMATPFTAGVVALMLDANPSLTPDEIKQILIDTATRMPGYQDYEVGAGYINAYAAVDKVLHRSKGYKNFSSVAFNAQYGEIRPATQRVHIDYNPAGQTPISNNRTTFTVEPGMDVADVLATVDTSADQDTGNLVGLKATSPSGRVYSSGSFPIVGSGVREIVIQQPEAGTWSLEAGGARSVTFNTPQPLPPLTVTSPTQLAAPGTVDGTVTQVKFIKPTIADIIGHPQQAAIEVALKNRLIDTFDDGTFRPDSAVTREDFARTLILNTPLRQTIGDTPKFADVSGDLARIAEAITANGSTLRDYTFEPAGMMSASGTSFNPTGTINRIDLAVALVRALGHDTDARNLANSTVTYNGTALSDNDQIPPALRGYVQLAINLGILEVYPAELRQIAPGQFQAIPGPRVEPTSTVTRAALAVKLNRFAQLFKAGQ